MESDPAETMESDPYAGFVVPDRAFSIIRRDRSGPTLRGLVRLNDGGQLFQGQ